MFESSAATAVYAPYGAVLATSGSMPTQRGYTGQLLDPSGLQYYHARYYDPSIGQFISADTMQGPNRYAYVGGNPETWSDPTGHIIAAGAGGGGDAPNYNANDSYSIPYSDAIAQTLNDVYTAATIGVSMQEYATSNHGIQLINTVNGYLRRRYAVEVNSSDPMGTVTDVPDIVGGMIKQPYRGNDDITSAIKSIGIDGRNLSGLKMMGWGLAIAGSIWDAWTSGSAYYAQSHNLAGSIGVGIAHGAFSLGLGVAGGYYGSLGGAVLGTALCGPACGLAGYFVGGIVGGMAGSWIGDFAASHFSNSIANATSNITSAVTSDVSNTVTNAWNTVAGWI